MDALIRALENLLRAIDGDGGPLWLRMEEAREALARAKA